MDDHGHAAFEHGRRVLRHVVGHDAAEAEAVAARCQQMVIGDPQQAQMQQQAAKVGKLTEDAKFNVAVLGNAAGIVGAADLARR